MTTPVNPPDFSDDLNFVVTAKEAARWYGLPYAEVRYELVNGLLVGRLSFDTWLVSVDSLHALYGQPPIAAGRRARWQPAMLHIDEQLQQPRGE